LLLQQIVPSLLEALNTVGLPYEIIVSDDASTDDSVKYLNDSFKEIIVQQNNSNSGFSITANKGIFASRHSHVLLLNNDVRLTKNYFTSLLRYFDKPDTFGVMGRIIGWDNDVIQDGGKYPFFHGVKIKTSLNYIPLNSKPDSWLYSMYLSGANAFVDREKILFLKGFDEIFSPYYAEDFDLSLRAWRLGWKCYYEHSAVCKHKTSLTIKSIATKKKIAIIYNRNKMYLHAIHLSGFKKMLWFLQLIGELIIYTITFRLYFIISFNMFWKTLRKVAESKKNFNSIADKARCKKSVREVANEIIACLNSYEIKKF
jgi:GT2 family glycosyltransferase